MPTLAIYAATPNLISDRLLEFMHAKIVPAKRASRLSGRGVHCPVLTIPNSPSWIFLNIGRLVEVQSAWLRFPIYRPSPKQDLNGTGTLEKRRWRRRRLALEISREPREPPAEMEGFSRVFVPAFVNPP
jgi:hypothetical protein